MSTEHNVSDAGSLFIIYKASSTTHFVLSLGYPTKISFTYNKNTMLTPIVTKKSTEAFPLDSGTTKTYSVNGYRLQPSSPDLSGTGSPIYRFEVDDPSDDQLLAVAEQQAVWTCRLWQTHLMSAIDRWQMRTDGCWLRYVPGKEGNNLYNIYTSIGSNGKVHGYLRSIETTYNSEYNEALSYYLTFAVGTAYMLMDEEEQHPAPYNYQPSVDFARSGIAISGGDEGGWHWVGGLANSNESAVESYSITGGPGTPFEQIEMVLSIKKLKSIAPELMETDSHHKNKANLIKGKSKVQVSAVGRSTFVVTDFKTTSNNTKIKITGYCPAMSYKTRYMDLTSKEDTPMNMVRWILSEGRFGVRFEDIDLVTNVVESNLPDESLAPIRFEKDVNVWYMLQICSVLLGCKLFFANDKAYLIDYRKRMPYYDTSLSYLDSDDSTTLYGMWVDENGDRFGRTSDVRWRDGDGNLSDDKPETLYDDMCLYADYAETIGDGQDNEIQVERRGIELYPDIRYSGEKLPFMYGRVLGSSYDEGNLDAVVTKVVVRFKDTSGNDDSITCIDRDAAGYLSDSFETEYLGTAELGRELHVPELKAGGTYAQAQTFAERYLEYVSEVQSVISMTVKETENDNGTMRWRALFCTASQADSIRDSTKDLPPASNVSMYGDGDERKYQLLYLSRYVRQYPDMKTEYTWGIVSENDLPNRLAKDF